MLKEKEFKFTHLQIIISWPGNPPSVYAAAISDITPCLSNPPLLTSFYKKPPHPPSSICPSFLLFLLPFLYFAHQTTSSAPFLFLRLPHFCAALPPLLLPLLIINHQSSSLHSLTQHSLHHQGTLIVIDALKFEVAKASSRRIYRRATNIM